MEETAASTDRTVHDPVATANAALAYQDGSREVFKALAVRMFFGTWATGVLAAAIAGAVACLPSGVFAMFLGALSISTLSLAPMGVFAALSSALCFAAVQTGVPELSIPWLNGGVCLVAAAVTCTPVAVLAAQGGFMVSVGALSCIPLFSAGAWLVAKHLMS